MFGIGAGEMLLILVIALVVLGPERMPKFARDVGKAVGDLRRTSDELRSEFLNADKYVAPAAAPAPPPPVDEALATNIAETPTEPAAPVDVGVPEPGEGVTAEQLPEPAEGVTADQVPEPVPDETDFDRDAREARARLNDPERRARAEAEGWPVPKDDAGTTDRWA